MCRLLLPTSERRQHVRFVELEKRRLVRADLMNVDVVEPLIEGMLKHLDMCVGIRIGEQRGLPHVLGVDQLAGLLEMRRRRKLLR